MSLKLLPLKFIIVGHVDHGKSTLIGRLLFDTGSLPEDKIAELKKMAAELGESLPFAFIMDYLEEEREQLITIDTSQSFFKSKEREYVIIDAPGHVEFIKNMITGASQADAAILIIDAGEGIKEQTKRHAYILKLLGISRLIVAINKMDIVGFKEEIFLNIKKEVEKFLIELNISIDFSTFIPISALEGDNVVYASEQMSWYQGGTILDNLDVLKNSLSNEDKPLIFPVQLMYRSDSKEIILGRIEAGVITEKQEIKILPANKITQVKSIEKFPKNVDTAYAGESIGITIEDNIFIKRGDIICSADKEPYLTDRFYANIFWLSSKDLLKDEELILRCSTQEILCKIEKIESRIDSATFKIIETNANQLKNLEVGEVIVKTASLIVIQPFNDLPALGRFVLMQNENICAGGIVAKIL